jgi:hypothetical protein
MAPPARSAERRTFDWVTRAGAVAFDLAAEMALPALFAVHPPTDHAHGAVRSFHHLLISQATVRRAGAAPASRPRPRGVRSWVRGRVPRLIAGLRCSDSAEVSKVVRDSIRVR